MEGQIKMADKTKTDAKAPDPADEARKVADAAKEAEAAEAPEEVEAGEETGMKALVEDLHERRRGAKLGGGEQKIALQHERGKLTARERLELLLDPGSFEEIDMLVRPRTEAAGDAVAEAVVVGWGKIDARPVYVYSFDFTLLGGSLSETVAEKIVKVEPSGRVEVKVVYE